MGRSPSPRSSTSGAESSDDDSSVSASAGRPSARSSSLETTPDHIDASNKSFDSESASSQSQSDSKAEEEDEEGEEEEEDDDDEAEPGPDDLDEPWEYTFQVCFRVVLLLYKGDD